ncbi:MULTISPECIES: DNA-processing protein DprA [Melioribacter]
MISRRKQLHKDRLQDEKFNNLVSLKTLLSVDGIGPYKIFMLLNKFKSFRNILSAEKSELMRIDGISNKIAERIINAPKRIDSYESKVASELNLMHKLNGKVVTYWDEEYPELLRNIYYPPLILYIAGNFDSSDKYGVAIVGTRKPTNYGIQQAEKFASELVKKGIIIISGLARGIDSYAHRAAINSGGRTIAVIGSGVDVIYPPENARLFKQITEQGAIVSEFEPGTKPDAQNFPRRNRIISGLSLGVLIIETRQNGGAMQTAAYALDQNREIFALPGNVNSPQSEGPNLLIQKGEAKLVITADDVLDELGSKLGPEKKIGKKNEHVSLSLFEEKIIEALGNEALHIDIIADKAAMNTSECLVHLLSLEFKGLVKQLPGKIFMSV